LQRRGKRRFTDFYRRIAATQIQPLQFSLLQFAELFSGKAAR
jgi:hypothetical protein